MRALPTKREMHAPLLLLVTPPSESLLVDGLLHAHGLAGVNHVLGEAAALHVQGVDADVDTGDALGLKGRDGNGEDLGVGRKRVARAGGKHVLDAAVDVDVHVLFWWGGGERGRSKGGSEEGQAKDGRDIDKEGREEGEEVLPSTYIPCPASR